jgi:hypothetical protein
VFIFRKPLRIIIIAIMALAVALIVVRFSELETADETGHDLLTLDDVRSFAKRGDELKPDDLAGFAHTLDTDGSGAYYRYPISGGRWELEANVSYLDDEEDIVDFRLIPSGFDFRPQGTIKLSVGVDEYIAYVESYDPSLTELTPAEETAALEAVNNYYENTGLGKVTEIARITAPSEFADAVIVDRVKGKLAAFYVTVGDVMPQRSIVLTQTDGGAWDVITEGS